MRKVKSMLVVVLAISLTELALGVLPKYEIVDLGTLGGNSSNPSGINDAGQVVGSSETTDGRGHGFLWDDVNGMMDMTELLDDSLDCDYIQSAIAINNNGQIVGAAHRLFVGGPINIGLMEPHFFWDSETGFIELLAFKGLGKGHMGETIRAVNDNMQVVGTTLISATSPNSPDISMDYHALLWDSTNGATDLGTLGGRDSSAYSINESGVVVGSSTTSVLYENDRDEVHAFLWDGDNGMLDLGTLAGNDSSAWAINNFNKVVGASVVEIPDENRMTTISHAFVWTHEEGMIDIHDSIYAGSIALGINDADQVVGVVSNRMNIDHLNGFIIYQATICSPSGCPQYRSAFLWDKRYGMVNLNDLLPEDSGWDYLESAKSINNKGQVIGIGVTNDGEKHGFLMTPISDSLYISLNIQNAIDEKLEALEKIDAALEKELAAYDLLGAMLKSGDFGGLKKRDIIRANRGVSLAIQLEKLSKRALRMSVRKLEHALIALGSEPDGD